MNTQKGPFYRLSPIQAPASLRKTVYERIASFERRARAMKLSSLVGLALISLSGFVASCVYVWNTVAASGFTQYVALVFSDATALSYSKDLGLSILESLPALGIAAALAAALVSVGSFWSFSRAISFKTQ